MRVTKPSVLNTDSKIALIAPAWSFDAELFQQGRAFLERKTGAQTLVLDSLHDKYAYYAGSDERRLNELYHWLTHPEVDALIGVRGGYGCARIYSALLKKLKRHSKLKPKVLVGYSDLTILLNGFLQDLGWITFHGPVLVGKPLREPLPLEEKTFLQSLFSKKPLGKIKNPEIQVLYPGEARAPIVGGCLSLVATSIGTPYEIETDGKILFLEDVGEYPYRIDRMLLHLLHAGKFSKVRGIVFGQLHQCLPPKNTPEGPSAKQAIELALGDFLKTRKIPVLFDFPAGHGSPQVTFPIGAKVELVAPAGKNAKPYVNFVESGVR